MLRVIALRGKRGTFATQGNVIVRDRSHVVELLLQLENKQQIMQNNVETQHKHMYIYW